MFEQATDVNQAMMVDAALTLPIVPRTTPTAARPGSLARIAAIAAALCVAWILLASLPHDIMGNIAREAGIGQSSALVDQYNEVRVTHIRPERRGTYMYVAFHIANGDATSHTLRVATHVGYTFADGGGMKLPIGLEGQCTYRLNPHAQADERCLTDYSYLNGIDHREVVESPIKIVSYDVEMTSFDRSECVRFPASVQHVLPNARDVYCYVGGHGMEHGEFQG